LFVLIFSLLGGSDAGSEIGSKAPSQAKSLPSTKPGGPYDSKPADNGSKAGSVMSGTSFAKDKSNGLELNANGGFGLLTKEVYAYILNNAFPPPPPSLTVNCNNRICKESAKSLKP
jgi:hypothetical protein